MTTLQEAAQAAMKYIRSTADYKAGHPVAIEAAEDLSDALAQQGEQQVCAGCGIPAGDVHMSTCKSGKWPSRVSNGDTAAPAPMTAKRAAYFMERSKKDEKLLGPNEQAAVAFVLEMLAQQGEQKPIGYVTPGYFAFGQGMIDERQDEAKCVPVYAAAPAPQPEQ